MVRLRCTYEGEIRTVAAIIDLDTPTSNAAAWFSNTFFYNFLLLYDVYAWRLIHVINLTYLMFASNIVKK